MFELLTSTKLKITDVVVLSQKNRSPDDNPGVKISVECAVPNYALTHFDGALRGMLFQKKPGAAAATQQTLDGVEPVSDLPHITTIGQKLGWFHWDFEGTGYTLAIGHGIGGKSDLELADCTAGNFRMHGNEGGTVDLRFDIESADASEKAFGRLAKLKSTEVDATLRPPEVQQDDIERPAPKLTTAQLRAANTSGKTPEQALAESVGAPKALEPVKGWPFPIEPGGNGGPNAKSAPVAAVPAEAPKKGAAAPAKTGAQSRRGAVPAAAYRDPESGQTWSGRGLKPKWLTVQLERGKSLADFAVAKAH